MRELNTVLRKCPGTDRSPEIKTRDDDPTINPGEVIHVCPVCGRKWARNTLQDWSHLPTPRHMVKVIVEPAKRVRDVPARYENPRIEFWDDERMIGNSIVVTLKWGFTFIEGQHAGVMGFDTATEAREAILGSFHCYCEDCVAKIGEAVQ